MRRYATLPKATGCRSAQTLEALNFEIGPTLYRGIGADPPAPGDVVHGLSSWTTRQHLANDFALNEAWRGSDADGTRHRGRAGLLVGHPASFNIEAFSPAPFSGSGEHLVLDYRVTDVRTDNLPPGIDWLAYVEPVESVEPTSLHGVPIISVKLSDTGRVVDVHPDQIKRAPKPKAVITLPSGQRQLTFPEIETLTPQEAIDAERVHAQELRWQQVKLRHPDLFDADGNMLSTEDLWDSKVDSAHDRWIPCRVSSGA